jgi:hypothetical protein
MKNDTILLKDIFDLYREKNMELPLEGHLVCQTEGCDYKTELVAFVDNYIEGTKYHCPKCLCEFELKIARDNDVANYIRSLINRKDEL